MTFKERIFWMIDLILSVNLKDLFANNSLTPALVKYLLPSVKLKYLPVIVCTQPVAIVLSIFIERMLTLQSEIRKEKAHWADPGSREAQYSC